MEFNNTFANIFANTCKENEWFIANSIGNPVDFDKAEQYWHDECTTTNYEDWSYSEYLTHMASVCEKQSWIIYQRYPESSFKLDDELIEYFVEIFTHGFATNDDSESDNMSEIENDNDSEHGVSAFASFEEIWEQHFGSNTENIENPEITSEDWDNVRRQLDFDGEEEEQE